jgi:hypothetical protein
MRGKVSAAATTHVRKRCSLMIVILPCAHERADHDEEKQKQEDADDVHEHSSSPHCSRMRRYRATPRKNARIDKRKIRIRPPTKMLIAYLA